ncbi:death-on-curing family protein [Caldalkalibacillus thermarum TA2.A1]|uniref:Death-on-curing family protein n=1 Tax=Caldalkalibacillus thermarum (strain TA2.A1) TaxID=986075 RepID=F5LA20_CALTT|nr:type II toxin-antitoxin system death-on-curing family toxin [Caldalkalibacillus thermarum]EGL81740.1 death-on-curing family protein [Caldalkalibacillus thermarum TA2.A1]QZT34120.1 type II toxin-antitoxin system death-on-curing family toxin [Caldalkalibacillus thermarum TA2.A1]
MATRYLSPRDVAVIHFMVMKKYGEGEQAGIKDQGLLESAVYRPQQTVFGQEAYPTLFEKAAALFESLVRNHPFFNGNKRTAFVATDIFLKKNGYKIIPDDENEVFIVLVANGNLEFSDIIEWFKQHTEEYR